MGDSTQIHMEHTLMNEKAWKSEYSVLSIFKSSITNRCKFETQSLSFHRTEVSFGWFKWTRKRHIKQYILNTAVSGLMGAFFTLSNELNAL